MLISTEVEVKWFSKTREHYESKGYKFTKYGDKFICKIEDLTNACGSIVQVKCDYCGNVIEKTYEHYLRHRKDNNIDCCKQCAGKKANELSKLTLEFVKSEFEKRGYVLIDGQKYINNREKLQYICPYHKDKELWISYHNLQKGRGCKYCGYEATSKQLRLDFSIVKEAFESRGLILLPGQEKKYKNTTTKLKFICNNHKDLGIQETHYGSVIESNGCRYCGFDSITGENNYNWKGSTDLNRWLRGKISDWKRDSLIKANYKCELTGNGGVLEVHHRFSFANIVEIVLEELNLTRKNIGDYSEEQLSLIETNFIKHHEILSMPIVLKHNIHKLFHSEYGKQNNTPEQFEEFKERYKKGEFNDT